MGDFAQQEIAGGVPIAVIDEVEALEVDREHGEAIALVATLLPQGKSNMLYEEGAIGQAGETVVQCVVDQLLFGPLAQMYVAD